MSVGCLLSGGPHPCEPCVRCLFGPGSHHPPFSASHWNPFCGTCGGGMSPIHCGMVKAERLKGHLSPGSWQWPPCCPFWGWPWKKPDSHCHLCHSQPLSPLPLLGLQSGTPAAFLEANLRHTFLWVCSAKEETNACFRHCPHP